MTMVIIITIIIILFFGTWVGAGGGGGEVIPDSNLIPVFGKPLLLQSCHISHSNKYLAHSICYSNIFVLTANWERFPPSKGWSSTEPVTSLYVQLRIGMYKNLTENCALKVYFFGNP